MFAPLPISIKPRKEREERARLEQELEDELAEETRKTLAAPAESAAAPLNAAKRRPPPNVSAGSFLCLSCSVGSKNTLVPLFLW